MPGPYRYAVLRVVPRVDREEFINAGVIVYAPERRFLKAAICLNEDRLRALWPGIEIEPLLQHLSIISKLCEGDPAAGPIAALNHRERFHWLTTPRSTVVQTAPAKTGLADDLDATLEHLVRELCL